MTYSTDMEMLTGLKYCALLLVIIAVLLIAITIILAIILYKKHKIYIETRYIADRIDAIYKNTTNTRR